MQYLWIINESGNISYSQMRLQVFNIIDFHIKYHYSQDSYHTNLFAKFTTRQLWKYSNILFKIKESGNISYKNERVSSQKYHHTTLIATFSTRQLWKSPNGHPIQNQHRIKEITKSVKFRKMKCLYGANSSILPWNKWRKKAIQILIISYMLWCPR